MSLDHAKAKATVLAVLSDKAVNEIDFHIGVWSVAPDLYHSVADAIRQDRIAIIHDPELRKVKMDGIYIHKFDMLGIASATIGGSEHRRLMQQQKIIHECTHAGFDIERRQGMTHLESEGAAYVAGYVFLVAKVGKREKVRKYWVASPDPKKDKIAKTALEIAKNIYIGDNMPEKLWIDLEEAIGAHPLYKDKINKVLDLDGVGNS